MFDRPDFHEPFLAPHARAAANTMPTTRTVASPTDKHQNEIPPASQVRHLTQLDLSRRWRMSTRTLEAWRYKRVGPAYLKLSGTVVYRLQDVRAFELSQLRGGATSPVSLSRPQVDFTAARNRMLNYLGQLIRDLGPNQADISDEVDGSISAIRQVAEASRQADSRDAEVEKPA